MAKKPDLVIIDDADGGKTLAPARAAKTKPEDTLNPIDTETGERTFDDLDSRFKTPIVGMDDPDNDEETDAELAELFPKSKKPAKKDEDEDEQEDGLDETDEQPEEEPEEEPDLEEETEEEGEEELAPRRGIKGRIDRERRLRAELKADNDDLRARIDQLQQTVEVRASDETFATTTSGLNAKIEAKRAELLAAEEAGNSTDKIRLLEELSDLKADLRTATQQHDAAKAARESRKTTVSAIVARKVDQWKRQHPRFDRDPVFASFALGIDRVLMAEGFDPETTEYYEELDRRAAKRYPEEYKGRKLKLRDEGDGQRPKHPSRAQRRESDGERAPAKKKGEFEVGKDGRVKLTKLHVRTMRTFNLDPDSAEDVREFVRNNS